MPMHPQVQALVDKLASSDFSSIQDLSPDAARAQYATMVELRAEAALPMASVEDRQVPTDAYNVPVRIYRPEGVSTSAPCFVFMHGGGHVFGNLDTHDTLCRNLATAVPCVVVSVDYRLAPEHKFPAAADDSFAAVQWVATNANELGVDPDRLAIGGDSAGGNLAAVCALMAREASGPSIALQILVYPVTDYGCDTPSYERYKEGYGMLERNSMKWFRNHYLRSPADYDDWRAAPLQAKDVSGLPPACVILAEYDVLHDEGLAYAERLKTAGVDVEVREFEGMIHGFFSLTPTLDGGAQAQAYAASQLRGSFGLT